MPGPASELARRLAREAEAVCRHYLPAGRRYGGTWRIGDVANEPGGSLCVRLVGPETGPRAAGKWTDYATGEHGDLLDLIAANLGTDLSGAISEADRFLGLTPSVRGQPSGPAANGRGPLTAAAACAAARRLFARAEPIRGTLAACYLQARGIVVPTGAMPLRYMPACRLRLGAREPDQSWPALIAAVTDPTGAITGIHRIYLARDGTAKAPVADPCRSLGRVHGYAVRFGAVSDILAAGEGIETMLSLRTVLPSLPVAATLSASHLGAFVWPARIGHLLIAVDRDAAGCNAAERLAARAREAPMPTFRLDPVLGDWNDDLRQMGIAAVRKRLNALLGLIRFDRGAG